MLRLLVSNRYGGSPLSQVSPAFFLAGSAIRPIRRLVDSCCQRPASYSFFTHNLVKRSFAPQVRSETAPEDLPDLGQSQKFPIPKFAGCMALPIVSAAPGIDYCRSQRVRDASCKGPAQACSNDRPPQRVRHLQGQAKTANRWLSLASASTSASL